MSNGDSSGAPAPSGSTAKRGVWQFVGNAAFLGALGTVFVGLFQYVSAYHDSVATLAKNDLDAATNALTEAVSTLANPLSLQERLIWSYSFAKKNDTENDDDAYETKSARAISKSYEDSVASLSKDVDLLARKMEIYLDLPGDLSHAAANNSSVNAEPISGASLRAFEFHCENPKHMAVFGKEKSFGKDKSGDPSVLRLQGEGSDDNGSNDGGKPLFIHWKSVRDNLLTLEYCFEFTHWHMGEIRQWASRSIDDKSQPTKSINSVDVDIKLLKTLAKSQERRFHDFMSVATFKIEQFRVKYQPNGLLCTVLGLDSAIDHFTHVCTPRLVDTE